MIIGQKFSSKNKACLTEIARLSAHDSNARVSVKELNKRLEMDRTEIKNMLGFLAQLQYINVETIGGPLLYGHVAITEKGLQKAAE